MNATKKTIEKIITPLPPKFRSWIRFWQKIQSMPGWDYSHKIVKWDDIEYSVDEIKANCFEEVIKILPNEEVFSSTLRNLNFYRDTQNHLNWLLKLRDIFY